MSLRIDSRRPLSLGSASIAIVVVGIGLRLARLDVHSIWIDEAGTILVAQADDIVAALRADRHPPLSFLAFRAWMNLFGEADAVLRLLPAIVSSISLVILARLARSWLEPRAAVIAVALAAIAPIELWIAHEVRMYAFVECATLIAITAAWAYMRQPRWFVLGGVCVACAAATGLHYFGAFTSVSVAAVGVLAWKREGASRVGRTRALRLAAAAFAGAAVWIPWLVLVYRDQQGVGSGFLSNLSPRVMLEMPARLLVPSPDLVPPPLGWLVYTAAVPIAIAFGLFAIELWRKRRTGDIAAGLVFASPPACALSAAIVGPLNFIARYFAGSMPGAVLAIASGAASLRWLPARIVLVVFVLGGSGATTIALERTNAREDWRTACEHVASEWKPGDRVMSLTHLTDPYSQAPLRHYWRDAPEILASMTTYTATKGEVSPVTPRGRLHVIYRETTYVGDEYRDLTARFHVVSSERLRGAIYRLTLE